MPHTSIPLFGLLKWLDFLSGDSASLSPWHQLQHLAGWGLKSFKVLLTGPSSGGCWEDKWLGQTQLGFLRHRCPMACPHGLSSLVATTGLQKRLSQESNKSCSVLFYESPLEVTQHPFGHILFVRRRELDSTFSWEDYQKICG